MRPQSILDKPKVDGSVLSSTMNLFLLRYKTVEVNPLFKKEIKFSKYRKVPFVLADGVQVRVTCTDRSFAC